MLLWMFPSAGFSHNAQLISFFLMATVGILHGANDLFIFRKSFHKSISTIQFVGMYLFFAAIVGVIIYLEPVVGINLFVLISAFHFGEEHFSWWAKEKNIPFLLWCFFYGLSIFSLLFLTHLDTLEAFLLDNQYQTTVLSWSYYFAVPILVVQVVLSLAHLFLSKITIFHFLFLQAVIGLLYVMFTLLDLVNAFAFYFIIWHSIPSIIFQLKSLELKGVQGFKIYAIKAMPFYIMSIMGIGALYLWLGKDMLALSIIVLLGAMTTIPHIAVFMYLRIWR